MLTMPVREVECLYGNAMRKTHCPARFLAHPPPLAPMSSSSLSRSSAPSFFLFRHHNQIRTYPLRSWTRVSRLVPGTVWTEDLLRHFSRHALSRSSVLRAHVKEPFPRYVLIIPSGRNVFATRRSDGDAIHFFTVRFFRRTAERSSR